MANVTEYCLKIQIPEINKLGEIYLPQMSIYGIPWEVFLCKNEIDEQPWLGFYLHCAKEDETQDWSLWGSASFKLLSFSNFVKPVEYGTPALIFDDSGIAYGKSRFIQWNDLFDKAKNYVQNGAINLEVKVKAENPNDPSKSQLKIEPIGKHCDNDDSANFRLTVTNIANLMAVKSPSFKLHGLSWCLQIMKNEESELSVVLLLQEDSVAVSCQITMSIKLKSSKKDVHAIEKCDTKRYNPTMDLNVVKVVSWDELMKPENGFFNNDSITVKLKLSTGGPEGDLANSMETDPKTEVNPKQMECAICLEYIENQHLANTPCGHLFCFECIKKEVTVRGKCPTCTTPVQLTSLQLLYLPL